MLAIQLGPEVGHWANVVKGYALAIGVAFGMYLAARWWIYKVNQDLADRAARARQAYAAFLQRAMEQPELARPAGVDGAKARAQYPWFVGLLLTTAEQILLLDPAPHWRETIRRQLVPHRDYLATAAFRDGPGRALSAGLAGLVDEAVASTETAAAPDTGEVSSGAAGVRSIQSARR